MNAFRMEKAYNSAAELPNELTRPEADVMRFVNVDKDFLGKDATLATTDLPWVCAYPEIEPDGEVEGHGGETVVFNGKTVGSTTSTAFMPNIGKIFAFAYVKPHAAPPGTVFQVLIHGRPGAATVLAEPANDPASTHPRADTETVAAE